ncbi:hypothetical protein GCM10023333_16350 [Ferrimonas pelagia]|uniref:Sigma-54-dependent Fis family transcriptional regulator n=1 Tax=Ferrimonas pelagia TaxID=1177826 RepID=A0ABP9EQF2_9GAMM
MEKILIIDNNPAICDALSLLLELQGYACVCCQDPQSALDTLEQEEITLAIQDMNFSADTTSGEEGRTLFHQLRAKQADLPIILLTAWTDLAMAVALVKASAADYLGKPWDDDKLLLCVANLLELAKLRQQQRALRYQQQAQQLQLARFELCGLLYQSKPMAALLETATRIAPSDLPVLITGPNGAGKEKIAEIIQANSPLKDKPFIKVNVGALPSELMEAELFGAEAGAYTGANKARIGRFEAADGGTLFLDEMGNLPLSGQVKLLRVLQTGEFERLGSHKTRKITVRVISATNADLPAAIAAGRFREDLYYRLNVVQLALPPLAERPDDILPLAGHFLADQAQLAPAAEQALLQHPWPGNVRELENAIARAALLCRDGIISPCKRRLPPRRWRPPNWISKPSPPRWPATAALSPKPPARSVCPVSSCIVAWKNWAWRDESDCPPKPHRHPVGGTGDRRRAAVEPFCPAAVAKLDPHLCRHPAVGAGAGLSPGPPAQAWSGLTECRCAQFRRQRFQYHPAASRQSRNPRTGTTLQRHGAQAQRGAVHPASTRADPR